MRGSAVPPPERHHPPGHQARKHRHVPCKLLLIQGVCKLCDLGWAIYSKERRNTYCGTLDYVSPDILSGESYDNFVDVWALGVLTYEMLTGKAPFYNASRNETMNNIRNVSTIPFRGRCLFRSSYPYWRRVSSQGSFKNRPARRCQWAIFSNNRC